MRSARWNLSVCAGSLKRVATQFAGLCSTGIAFGQKVEADPQLWKSVDGKHYLFSSLKAKGTADGDPGVLSRAHTGFPRKKK